MASVKKSYVGFLWLKIFGYTVQKIGCMDSLNYLFFPDRCSLPNDMDLLYLGTNIFVRNEKKMMYEKIESRKGLTELSDYEKKQEGEKKQTTSKNS
jgi:hypothetical protein